MAGHVRLATPADLPAVAELFDIANAGLIAAVWGEAAGPGETWRDVAVREMSRPEGELTYTTTLVAVAEGEVAGMLIVNFLPDPWPDADVEAMPAHARPFWSLRARVPGALFLRDMAVFPAHRGAGLASALLDTAIRTGQAMGHDLTAAIVHESNTKLLTHYARRGMMAANSALVGEHPTYDPSSSWLLMTCRAPAGFVTPA